MLVKGCCATLVALQSLYVTAAPASRFKFYDLPTPLSGPCDLTTGPDGALWGQDQFVNKIFRIDTNTSHIQEFEIPFTKAPFPASLLPKLAGRTALACAIQPGADGNIYASNGVYNQLVRVNPTTKKVDVFTPKPFNILGDLQPFNDLYAGPTGMYFTQTTGNVVSHFDYKTHEFKNYPVPTLEGSPLGMFVSHDGYAWFAEFLGNKIGRLDPATGHIKEYPLPASLVGPAVIRVETENRFIYFTSFLGNAIGRIDEHTGEVVAYPNDTPGALAAEDTLDSKGNVWFSSTTNDLLNYLTPSTGKITHIKEPSVVAAPVGIPPYFEIAMHYDPGSNSIYFTEETASRVGRYQLD